MCICMVMAMRHARGALSACRSQHSTDAGWDQPCERLSAVSHVVPPAPTATAVLVSSLVYRTRARARPTPRLLPRRGTHTHQPPSLHHGIVRIHQPPWYWPLQPPPPYLVMRASCVSYPRRIAHMRTCSRAGRGACAAGSSPAVRPAVRVRTPRRPSGQRTTPSSSTLALFRSYHDHEDASSQRTMRR